jgi:hypothetical protein
MKKSYIIFLLLVILASLLVYFTFGKGSTTESMVNYGTDLTAVVPIPGATYGPNTENGDGFDPPPGYTKVEEKDAQGKSIWKMKPIIPYGYKIDPNDNTKKKLIVDPKYEKLAYSIDSYKTSTDKLLNQGPYEDIIPIGQPGTATEDTELPESDPTTKLSSKYYRIKPSRENNNKYVMKKMPDPIPTGYEVDSKNYLVFNLTKYALATFSSSFDPANLDTEYHQENPDGKQAVINNDELGKYYKFDENGKLIYEETVDASFSPVLYYVPGLYKYGSSNYVPNYEDSVYLSRTTRLPQSSPVYNTAGMLGGFCTQYKNDKFAIEEKCGTLDLNTCASTSCCTLIGGQKCVGGDQNGPTNPASYSDMTLRNKDFYYYQGKCYGNCKKSE